MYITKQNVLIDVAIEWMKGTKLYVKNTLICYYMLCNLASFDPFMCVIFNPYKMAMDGSIWLNFCNVSLIDFCFQNASIIRSHYRNL